MRKSIGIVTLYGEKNFGNKLQNYASQVFFSEMGFDCRTIRYRRHSLLLDKALKIKYFIFSSLGFRPKIPASQKTRENVFKDFSERYINMGETVNYKRIPKNLKKKYDYFVSGSDQVWHNYSNTKSEINYFMLSFAEPEQRLTMAPSFGIKRNEIPESLVPFYRKGLNEFGKLSCREEEAADLIYQLTKREAVVMLDPTMLIDRKHWYDIARKPANPVDGKYMIVYFLGGMSNDLIQYLKVAARDSALKIVDLYEVTNPFYDTTGPEEFLWWIKNACIVATDSFHATVFSILYKNPFLVYSRQNGRGMENRIDTLLQKFSLSDRKNVMDINKDILRIDYKSIDEILEKEIQIAKEFYSDISGDK